MSIVPVVRHLIACKKEPTMNGADPSAHDILYAIRPKAALLYPVWHRPFYLFAMLSGGRGICTLQAEMRLEEKPLDLQAGQQLGQNMVMTCIEWDLNLTVTLQFPQFIQRLSQDMLQKTGDGVLGFVVKRVSKSLTAKVQDDFHKTHEIKVPKQIKLRR